MPVKTYTYLALGDSYTIGESVPAPDNFPIQTVRLLRKAGFDFQSPDIVAKTGWTTDELQIAINSHHFHTNYDFVTLLIGVNNQYRNRSVEDYKPEFEFLLKQAIQFAGNDCSHVIVFSIPDWGATPFAEARLPDELGRNKKKIAKEIDLYNEANKIICDIYKVNYIDITTDSKKTLNDITLVASDGLHPSGKEYAIWAQKLVKIILDKLK